MDTPTSSHGARLLIDKEIDDITSRMQHSIRLLRTRRNQLSPAVNIPDEVLLEVFIIIKESCDVVYTPNQWISVTQICCHWRRVAVNSASLWACLPYAASDNFLLLMLERSKGAPLDVSFTALSPRQFSSASVTAIFREIERIRTLTFNWVLPEGILQTSQAMLAGLGKGAPLLEELTVEILDGLDTTYPLFTLDGFRHTPVLRKLCLGEVSYHWNTLPFSSLIHLTLNGKEATASISGAQFTDAFSQMERLEHLSINLCNIPLRQYTPSTNLQPICLPALERLEIIHRNGHQEPIQTFMSQLVHPRLHQLHIDLSETIIDHSTMIRLLGSSIRNGAFRSLTALEINADVFKIYSLPGAPSNPPAVHVIGGHSDDSNNSEVTFFEVIKEIMSCCVNPFDSSDTMSLERVSLLDLNLTAEQLVNLFAYLPHLKTIEGDSQIPLFDALHPASTPNDPTPAAPIPFSKLRSIKWKLRNSRLSKTDFSGLYNSLSARKAHGVAISELHLTGPRGAFRPKQIEKLSSVVATVTVGE